jgi:LPS export ABC transporter protein LptC
MRALLTLSFLLSLSACSDYAKKNVAKMMQADTLIYTQIANNVTIDYVDSGFLKARIKAPKLIGFKKDGNDIVKMPNGITANFFGNDGEEESVLTAEKGISYQTKKITEVSQNVQVINSKGEKLNTEKLIWDQNKQIIYTDKFVRITKKNEVLTGIGMECSQDFNNMHILKPRGEISIQPDSSSSK